MFNPDRVELVRLRLGLTKIGFAGQLGVDRKTLQRFEGRDYDLSPDAKRRLLAISDYPEAFFQKDAPEYPNPNGVSFRSLRSLTAGKRDAAMAAGALAFELDDWISTEYDLPDHDLEVGRDLLPAEAAMRLRVHWGIGERPIGNVINLLEAHGVRVFSLVEGTRHLDAYSLWRDDKPYIFLNTLKTAERSRFDAAHELGHLVMHRHIGSGHIGAEGEADSFASSFLTYSFRSEGGAYQRRRWLTDYISLTGSPIGVTASFALNWLKAAGTLSPSQWRAKPHKSGRRY